jgi:hypothetical protein
MSFVFVNLTTDQIAFCVPNGSGQSAFYRASEFLRQPRGSGGIFSISSPLLLIGLAVVRSCTLVWVRAPLPIVTCL